jgi:cysteine desulfurase / selenocysteine lyase
MAFIDAFETKAGLIHLNNAGLSPISRPAEEIVQHWVKRYREEGMFCNDAYLEAVDAARVSMLKFLDADPGSLAFLQSTAAAVSQIAFQMDLKPGDEVVMWDQEYGSHLYPWQEACRRSGATLVLVPSDTEFATPIGKLLAACGPKTKVIAVSWVQFQTGAVSDIEELAAYAQRHGIWSVVDAFQAIGITPFSFRKSGLDAIVGGSHKWMCSAVGVGYLCIKPERARQLRPHTVGAYTFGTCEDPTDLSCEPKTDALRFEAGSKQVLEILSLGAAADLIRDSGIESMQKEALSLAQMLADGLRGLGYAVTASNGLRQKTPIITFTPTEHAPYQSIEDLISAFTRAKISYARRGPGLRLAPHAHNKATDIRTALRLLQGEAAY